MTAPAPKTSAGFDWSSLPLILVNIFPLAMAAAGRFSIESILVLYWLELVFVGGFVFIKVLSANYFLVPALNKNPFILAAQFLASHLFISGLLGIFVLIFSLDMVDSRSNGQSVDISDAAILSGMLWLFLLFLSHGFSLIWNWFVRGERHSTSPIMILGIFGDRVKLLLVAIVLGSFVALFLKHLFSLHSAVAPACLLTIGKTILDLRAHRRSHDPVYRKHSADKYQREWEKDLESRGHTVSPSTETQDSLMPPEEASCRDTKKERPEGRSV
ncbi:MAG: hypothetical protein HN909_04430 [Phycisphaerales bacterium]|jgi:hypothetical protein|nr:hypothetical protein [Phycisphaerales bacterium]MBT7170999.1 hypothetical protein [Phycisphaerales bacterium]